MTTLRCTQIRKKISAFRDDALPPGIAGEVATHLEECAGCREDYARIDAVARLVAGAAVAAPPGFDERLRERLGSRRIAEKARKRRGRLARRASLLAATVLVAITVGMAPAVFRSHSSVTPLITDDRNLNLVLFGSADLDDTRDPSIPAPSPGNVPSE